MADDQSKKRLGRGLAALIGEMDQPVGAKASAAVDDEKPTVSSDRVVPIENIRANPNNPRRVFTDSDLEDLSNSISEHGVVQPILVRPVAGESDRWEIIAGERRWRASQRAGIHAVPIIVRDVDDRQALELAIIENVQRADLNPVEEALGYHASGRSAAMFEQNYGLPSTVALNKASAQYHREANGGYLSPRGLMIIAAREDAEAFDDLEGTDFFRVLKH